MAETITAYEEEAMDYFKSLVEKQEYPSDYGGEDFWENDGWLLTVSWNPTQTKLEEIAFELLKEELYEIDENNAYQVRFTHWACGYALQLNIRPIIDDRLTKAGEIIYEYTQDNGYEYLELASEDERHYEWEREMVTMEIGNDDLTIDQIDSLVTHLMHEEDVYVDGDGSLWVGSNGDLKTVIEGAIDYLFGNSIRAKQKRAANHPNQMTL